MSAAFPIDFDVRGGDLVSRIREWIARDFEHSDKSTGWSPSSREKAPCLWSPSGLFLWLFAASGICRESKPDFRCWGEGGDADLKFSASLLTLFSMRPSGAAGDMTAGRSIDTELKLIHEIRNGDRNRYAEIVARYQLVISRRMWKFSRIPAEHEELVQEVFVEAFFSLKNFRGDSPFEHWLQRIATRVGYRFWSHRRVDRSAKSSSGTLLDTLPSKETLEDPEREGDDAARILYQLLERLSTEDRLVMTLLHLENYSIAQIADQLGWSPGNVKVRAHRARKKLADWMQEIS